MFLTQLKEETLNSSTGGLIPTSAYLAVNSLSQMVDHIVSVTGVLTVTDD
jgi:hypothetical protein